MFIFDVEKEMAVNSEYIACMYVKEVKDDADKTYSVIAVIKLDTVPKSLVLYYGKSKQDCINWIVTMNNKIASCRVIK